MGDARCRGPECAGPGSQGVRRTHRRSQGAPHRSVLSLPGCSPVHRPRSPGRQPGSCPASSHRRWLCAVRTAGGLFYGLHHLRPLGSPGRVSVVVEVHRRPNWLPWGDPPPASELLATSVPDVLDIPGIFGLPPEQHAVFSAVHSWADASIATNWRSRRCVCSHGPCGRAESWRNRQGMGRRTAVEHHPGRLRVVVLQPAPSTCDADLGTQSGAGAGPHGP